MKLRFAVAGCALVAFVLTGCVGISVAERNAQHARRTGSLLAEEHVTRRAPDDVISQRAWTNILESCDADHLVFRAEDIRRFDARRLLLDDAMRVNDFSFVREVRALYHTRLAERVEFVRATLKTDLASLPKDGAYRFDRKELPWPASRDEQDRLWRQRLANDLLEEELSRELAEKQSADQKTPAAVAVLKRYEQLLNDDDLTDIEAANLFLKAVVSAYDPHSLYLSPEEYAMFQGEMNLKLCGVGAELEFGPNGAKITRVISGGPIAKDGRIHEGDRIVGVAKDGTGAIEPLAGKSQLESIKMLRGEAGTKVTLEVVHKDGAGTARYTLTRAEIKLDDDAASSHVVTVGKNKIGYLRLPQFYAETPEDFSGYLKRRTCSDDIRKELVKLQKQQVAGVIFDLRNNPGGSLDDAVKILGYFLRGGVAVSLKNPSREVVLPIPENTVICEVPVVVLTTGGSASASELVSGSLQDYGRAIIVGDPHTFGKGTAQEPKDLEDLGNPSALMLTGDLFYRAGGTSTQRCGVKADIVVPSLAGDLEDGEAEMPYALVGENVARANFQKAWNLDTFIPELTRLSEARRAKSAAWQRYLPLVKQSQALHARKEKLLDRAARKVQMREDKALRKEARRLAKLNRNAAKALEKDPVLCEGLKILDDLLRLNGGRKLPEMAETTTPGIFTGLDDD